LSDVLEPTLNVLPIPRSNLMLFAWSTFRGRALDGKHCSSCFFDFGGVARVKNGYQVLCYVFVGISMQLSKGLALVKNPRKDMMWNRGLLTATFMYLRTLERTLYR
jgi:hypothetical protein